MSILKSQKLKHRPLIHRPLIHLLAQTAYAVLCDVVKPNPLCMFRVHVYGEYLANEHECVIV